MENVKVVVFDVESEAYQAMSEIKNNLLNENFVLSQMAIIKNEFGQMIVKDTFDTGVETRDDATLGGIIGGLVGVITGPLGMILGGTTGHLIGASIDAKEADENLSIAERVSKIIPPTKTAIVALVQEENTESFDRYISKYSSVVITLDAAEVAEEIERDKKIQAELEKDAKKKIREEKINEKKENISKKKKEISEHFEKLKKKLKKIN